MILVEIQRPFSVKFRNGKSLFLQRGQRVQISERKLGELTKRGLAKIVSGEACPEGKSLKDSPTGTSSHSTSEVSCDRSVIKGEVLDPVRLIGEALHEIELNWTGGAWSWCKRHDPDTYRRIIAIEQEIDRLSRERRIQELEIALRRWKDAILALVKNFLKNSRRPHHGKLWS